MVKTVIARLLITISAVFATCCLPGGVKSSEPIASKDFQLEPLVIGAPERVEVVPSEVKLRTSRAHMSFLVTGYYSDGQVQDLTRAAELSTSDDNVVVLESGVARPAGEGSAQISIRVGGKTVQVPVEVSGLDKPDPISFHYETLAAVTKHGCNSGACHGSPSGKAGFRLSLMAYDSVLDQLTLIRESYGRRINTLEPESSLILVKPTMQVAHGGGLRLRKSDPSYGVLRQWIAEGCQVDDPNSPACVRLEVLPSSGRLLKWPAHTQQLLVLAHFSDGNVRDVTSLAKYSSSDELVAGVSADGLVVGQDRGQAAIMVRHLEKVETCTLTFVRDIDGFVWNDPPENNYVDRLVHQQLKKLQYVPSELCTDDEFIRRVHLDVIGVLPQVDRVEEFLADEGQDKRSRQIDELLERPEYARYWALKWADILRVRKQSLTTGGVHKYYEWLVNSVQQNMPFDEFARQLLTAGGSTFANPPANYYRTATEANDCAETTAQLFMGVRIQCAKCHNHPFERWTQDNYYGLAAFFNRVQRKNSKRDGELVVWMARNGEVTQPRTGKTMRPWLPLTGDVEQQDETDRRQILSKWLTGSENPFFSRVAANRIWAHIMGRGIVNPVDDFRDSNPPSNLELLAALAKDFVDNGYDQKHLLRTILNSRTYQLSSRTNPLNKDDTKYFSHAEVRLLSAEQLLDAICHVTDISENFKDLPAGTRATQLPSPDVENEFLKIFGQPERQTACACERSTESNLSQALQLFNGPLIHGKLQAENNRFRKLADSGESDEAIVKHLYLAALCRHPNDTEVESAVSHIRGKEDRVQALEDVCWVLLNTNEFLFQH